MGRLLKRPWLVGAVLLLVVVAVSYLVVVPVEGSGFSQATCDKIQRGWSHSQVDNLLNKWPGLFRVEWGAVWTDEDGNSIFVSYDHQLRVTGSQFVPTELSRFEVAKRRIERRIRALVRHPQPALQSAP
jgi:hypothetical protein